MTGSTCREVAAIKERILFYFNRLRERLWVKPLLAAAISIAAALVTKELDTADFAGWLPRIERDTVETLLEIMAASMLVIATFSVASMVSAYSSASDSATPRSYPLIVADDLSQNALSTFVGAFIFSIVALTALKEGYYEQAGVSFLFMLTLLVFAVVILLFVRWVDGIARLGRLENAIDKVEAAAAEALERRRRHPTLGGRVLESVDTAGKPIYGDSVGYVQHIKMDELQTYAEEVNCKVFVSCLPGAFSAPGTAVAHVEYEGTEGTDRSRILQAFVIGDERVYDDDPRFGLVVLSEIAGRALSPAVNDPGTAIDIIGTLVRLFDRWAVPTEESDTRFDRVYVPKLSVSDMFDDAFTSIGRDGAGSIEVAVRLQKAFRALAAMGNDGIAVVARHHSQLALSRAERSLQLPQEIEAVRAAAICAES